MKKIVFIGIVTLLFISGCGKSSSGSTFDKSKYEKYTCSLYSQGSFSDSNGDKIFEYYYDKNGDVAFTESTFTRRPDVDEYYSLKVKDTEGYFDGVVKTLNEVDNVSATTEYDSAKKEAKLVVTVNMKGFKYPAETDSSYMLYLNVYFGGKDSLTINDVKGRLENTSYNCE